MPLLAVLLDWCVKFTPQCTRCTVEPRHNEHFSDRRRVADEDDTVLDDAHESSSVASQDRGKCNCFMLVVKYCACNFTRS